MKRRNQSAVPLSEQKQVFKKYGRYLKDKNNIPSPCDKIFCDISKDLKCSMSEKAIYISLKRNHDYFFSAGEDTEESSFTDCEASNIVSGSESECNEKENQENNHDEKQEKHKVFKFSLDIYQWEKIQPITKYIIRNKTESRSECRQKKLVLPKYQWAHILREEIWKETKVPCSFTFKSHSIKYNDRITCYGSCTQCKAEIKLHIDWPTDKIAICEGFLTNYDKSFHHSLSKKVKLTPVKRKELCEELKHNAAIIVRNKLTNEMMSDCDPEPPCLPTTGCLRVIKHEYNKSQYYHDNPILALWIMTKVTPYKDIIKHISMLPFYMFYWSPAQDLHYQQYMRCKRVIMSLDATGSIFKEFGPTQNMIITKHIFLYSGVMYDSNNQRSVPITQMVSENQSMHTIYSWLKTWRHKNSPPNEVIVDDSAALIGAAVKAFTKYDSTKDYIVSSFNILNEGLHTPEETYIRLDTSHFVRILFNLTSFKNVDPRVKFFYCKCFLYIKSLTNYERTKEVFIDLITVCLNKFVSAGARCDSALLRLKLLLEKDASEEVQENEDIKSKTTTNRDSIFEEIISEHSTSEAQKEKSVTVEVSNVPKWFSEQINKEKLLQDLTDGDNDISAHENLYYMPSLLPTMTRLISELPLWSNIMMDVYKSKNSVPSSSNIESYFKSIKRYLCDISTRSHRLRVDSFLQKHTDYIFGELKTALAQEKNTNDHTNVRKKRKEKKERKLLDKKEFKDESIFTENPSLVENWKGLGIHKSKTQKPQPIPLLLNGNKTRTGLKNVLVQNTCAFDAVSQIIAVGCVDGFDLSTTVLSSENVFCKYIKEMINPKNSKQFLYKLRAEVLGLHFTKKVESEITYINCNCPASYIFEIILKDELYSADRTELCTNEHCTVNNIQRKIIFLSLDWGIVKKGEKISTKEDIDLEKESIQENISAEGKIDLWEEEIIKDKINAKELETPISSLNEAANAMLCEDFNMVTCRRNNCKGIRTFRYNLKNMIAFEFSQTQIICIDDIPLNIVLEGITYDILGVVEFISPGSFNIESIGHYTANCYRNQKWVCYDDMFSSVKKTSKQIIAHIIVYGKKSK